MNGGPFVSRGDLARAFDRAGAYAARHPDSPIARGCEMGGPLLLTDAMRPEIEHAVGPGELRTAYSLGILSTTAGVPADEHQVLTGLWPELTEDAYAARWIADAVRWHRSAGWQAQCQPDEFADDYEPTPAPVRRAPAPAPVGPVADVPGAVLEYLLRLVHEPKIAFAGECVAALQVGAELPAPVDDEPAWCADVRRKVRRHWGRRDA